MQLLNVDELIPHMKNSYFFDDIEGEPWMAFLESIKTSGVIEPVIATQDKVIVSGHQRVRACKKLGIKQVWTDIRTFDSDDEVLKQLIETNIRQRGIGNTNAVKLGRCIAELERIYGIKNGGDRKSDQNNLGLKTQKDLASDIGISDQQLRNYKSLTDLIPELQDAVQSGQITATTAMGFVKKLSPEEQAQLSEQISGKEKISSKEVQNFVDQIETLKKSISEKDVENVKLKQKLANRQTVKVEIKEVEVAPADYNTLKAKAKEADAYKKDFTHLQSERVKDAEEIRLLKERIADLESRSDIEELQKKLETEAGYFAIRTYEYIQKNGGYVWITERMEQLPEKQRKEFINTVYAIDAFAKQMVQNIGGYGIE